MRCAVVKRAPAHVHDAGFGVDLDIHALAERVSLTQGNRRAPGLAAIQGAAEVDNAGSHAIHGRDVCVSYVHISGGDGLRDRATPLRNVEGASPSRSGDVNGHPRLIQELRGVAVRHDSSIDITNWKAVAHNRPVFLVVQVHEACHEHDAIVCATIEGDASVIEQPIRACPHHRVGRRRESVQRRSESLRGHILRETGQQGALPARTAVCRDVLSNPGFGRSRAGRGPRRTRADFAGLALQQIQINGAVVVGTRE